MPHADHLREMLGLTNPCMNDLFASPIVVFVAACLYILVIRIIAMHFESSGVRVQFATISSTAGGSSGTGPSGPFGCRRH